MMPVPERPSKPNSILSPSAEDLELAAEEAAASQPEPESEPEPELHPDSRQFSGEGLVDEEIRPQERGRVQFRSSWWFARCNSDIVIPAGARVEVIGLETENMTLLVVPYGKKKRDSESQEKKEAERLALQDRDSILTPQPDPN